MPASIFLQNAVAVFRLNNLSLRKTTDIKAYREVLDKKYWEREYGKDDPENDFGRYLIRRQIGNPYDRKEYKTDKERYEKEKKVTAVVLEKDIVNPLQIPTFHYYYVVHRTKIITTWARSLDIKGYGFFEKGFYLPFYILKHIENNDKWWDFSSIVLMVDGEQKPYVGKATLLRDFFMKNGMSLLINAYGELTTGFPLSIMEERENVE